MQKIIPCIWFDNNAEQAVKLYTSLFKGKKGKVLRYDASSAKVSGQLEGSVLTIEFTLLGQDFVALNGGPIFKLNPSISLMVHCKSAKEVDRIYSSLSKGGEVMMALDKYPFSERYAFLKDRFGVCWQVMLSPKKPHIAPTLLFVGKSLGDAKPALDFYRKIFPKFKLHSMTLYKDEIPGMKGKVMHSSFSLFGNEFVAMDGPGPHQFGFNESISFMVDCKDQKEVDYYWKKFTLKGEESQCGWLKDQFGISWQITPTILTKLISDKDRIKASRVMNAMLGMGKIKIDEIVKAYKGK